MNAAPAAQHLERLRRLPLHHDQAIGQTSETAENDIFMGRQRSARHDPGLPLAAKDGGFDRTRLRFLC
jgi:hypothetical protein